MSVAVAVAITVILMIAIIVLVYWAVWFLLRELTKRREGGPDRIALYFDENFRNLIDEWDLRTRSSIKDWRRNMSNRLDGVRSDIARLNAIRESVDARLDRLTREMKDLEK